MVLRLKAHIGVEADSGLVHTCVAPPAAFTMWLKPTVCSTGQETDVFADAGYQGAHKRPDAQAHVQWHVAMRPGLRKLLDKSSPRDAMLDQLEHIKASIRAKVEHPFRVIKHQFRRVKVRYRGLQEHGPVAHAVSMANLWLVRRRLHGRLA